MSYKTENPEWYSFYPEKSSSFYINKAGYFDERPEVVTSVTQLIVLVLLPFLVYQSAWFLFLIPFVFFGWGRLFIHLPIKTGIEDCDSAAWGFNYHDDKIWIYIGGGGNFEGGKKWKTISMPWDLEWVRTSTLLQDGFSWFNETKDNKIDWKDDPNGERHGSYHWILKNRWTSVHPYVDKYDGTIVNATISVKVREWRPKWFMWTTLFAKVSRDIDVSFDKEVGKKKRSWKGGTLGCGYEMLPGETPFDCLKRMEKERSF